ncbi:ABC transporter ATP-binding protein [Berryella wangjianweii]|uniref:ABC transporter ATP-binding protein n=1 Tax=Berryella wangjianweii TaxID=2734634 RepID=A0A6M8J7B0_9ACTN|nr:ABC transporter ATP-binding protein [Berryella wangjianweii]QKF07776.1 ABC transporter ATP-binding protein [Berryella wangjianweii]
MGSKSPRSAAAGKDRPPSAVAELYRYAGTRAPLLTVGCVLSAIAGVMMVLPLVFLWVVVNEFLAPAGGVPDQERVLFAAWMAFGLAVGGFVVYALGLMCTHFAAFRIAGNMRRAMAAHLAKVPLGYFSSSSSGSLRRVIDGCTAQTEDLAAHKLPDFTGALLAPVAFVAVTFWFDWVMGLVCLVPVAVGFLSLGLMLGGGAKRDGQSFMERYQAALVRMSAAATEYVRGVPVMKMFQQTVRSFKVFHAAIVDYRRMATDYVRFCEPAYMVQLVAVNGTFAVLVPAGIVLAAGAANFAAFLSNFIFYVIFSGLTSMLLMKVMYSSETVMMARDAFDRAREVLSTPVMEQPSQAQAAVPTAFDVRLQAVGFTYPGKDDPALSDVSLCVPEGGTVALVGPSGGGKSTLASLVARFWDPAQGTVSIGGIDVRRIPAADLMRIVAFVFQDDRLLKRSIRENVRIGRPQATDAEVHAALQAACCDDIVEKLPQGLDTVVGTKGVYLSGGECQRIALARALLKDAPVVVLDEATAFADPENEAQIQRALARLCAGKTVLMVAHRLSTVTRADQICVLDGGRVVERGTHEGLLAARGRYARMWTDYNQAVTWKIKGGDGHVA